jgi:hypothetical protein
LLRILSNWLQILAHLLNPSSPLGLGLERFTPDRIGKHRLNEPLFSDSRSVTYSLRTSQTNGLKTLFGSLLKNEFKLVFTQVRWQFTMRFTNRYACTQLHPKHSSTLPTRYLCEHLVGNYQGACEMSNAHVSAICGCSSYNGPRMYSSQPIRLPVPLALNQSGTDWW